MDLFRALRYAGLAQTLGPIAATADRRTRRRRP